MEIEGGGRVRMGGAKVREERWGQEVYEGGYAGYVRDGLGVHWFEEFRSERGVWREGKREGEFVEEYREQQWEEFSFLVYEAGTCVEETLVVSCHPSKQPQVRRKRRGELVSSQELTLYELVDWRAKLKEARAAFKPLPQDHLRLLTPATAPRPLRFLLSEVRDEGLLSLDICETYLQWLSHSEHCQQRGRTAVLSIHTAFLFHQMQA